MDTEQIGTGTAGSKGKRKRKPNSRYVVAVEPSDVESEGANSKKTRMGQEKN